ncbi:hypothetical protein GOV11_04355 [Candidatus Woesearchaeota archaeon]|nr:hypothetical protein [Candidatus Woesearchaeota archaeon]
MEAPHPQPEDISPKTLFVLVVLVLVVSFIGAWVSISQVAAPGQLPLTSDDSGDNSAYVGFSIKGPVYDSDGASGKVVLNIKAPE